MQARRGTVAGFESLIRQAAWMPANETRPVDFLRPRSGPNFRMVVSARLAGMEFWRGHGIATVVVAQEVMAWEALERINQGWCRKTVEDIVQRLDWIYWGSRSCPRREPRRPLKTPKVVVNVPAGVPSPQTSSPWKIAAVEVMLELRKRHMTSAEIQAMGINPQTFRQRGWIQDSGERRGRAYLWTAGEPSGRQSPCPDEQWPEIVEALRDKGF